MSLEEALFADSDGQEDHLDTSEEQKASAPATEKVRKDVNDTKNGTDYEYMHDYCDSHPYRHYFKSWFGQVEL